MNRLVFLDGLRGLAAIAVLGYHLHTVFGGFEVFALGYLSVDFFFLLSGYVMARTYELRFATGLTPNQFFVRRFFRLWPLMTVGTSIGLAFALYSGVPASDALAMFAATVAFLPHAGAEPFALNRPVWSIFFEIVANVFHALVLWRLPTRLLVYVAIAALIAMVPYWSAGNFNLGNKANDFLGGFPRVLLAYSTGIVIFRLNPQIPSVPKAITSIASWLGSLSFPLYAVHYPLLQIAYESGQSPLAGAILAVAIASLCVVVSELKRHRWPRRVRKAAAI